MPTNAVGRELHDRATRGLALSSAEQTELERWYAEQDSQEAAVLASRTAPQGLAALRVQVDAAVTQLAVAAQKVQTLSAENEAVRREVSALEQKLALQSHS